MTNPPKVSVVLPFFNAKETLGDAIQSIINQSFKDWELILINNNSQDGSEEVANRFARTDNRIKVFIEPKQGVVFAANHGFAKARGQYIARMDADDFSYPTRLQKQVGLLESKHEIGVVSGLVNYVGDNSNGGFIRYVNWLNSIITPEEIQLNQFAEYPISNPTIMMRKELVKVNDGFRDGEFPEDYEYFLRLQEQGVKMEKVPETVLDWKDSKTRLTRTDNRYSHEAFFKLKAKYIAKWLSIHNTNHPDVWIWGGGKLAKKRSNYLREYGVNIISHIDISESRQHVTHFNEVDRYQNGFILSFVTSWNARQEVREYLNSHGFIEGISYLICA